MNDLPEDDDWQTIVQFVKYKDQKMPSFKPKNYQENPKFSVNQIDPVGTLWLNKVPCKYNPGEFCSIQTSLNPI